MAASENLNKDLFPGVSYTRRDTEGWGGFGFTDFTAYGQARDGGYSWSETPYARMTLERGKSVPNYTNESHEEGGYGPSDTNPDHSSAYPRNRNDPNQQGKLFKEYPTKISSFYADPSMKRSTMALMGMAVNEARRIGTGLEAPSSLSVHSSPLAKRGAEAGVLTPNDYNRDMSVSNNEDFLPRTQGHDTGESPYRYGDLEVSPEEVSAAKDTVKGLLRQQGSVKRAAKRASARRSTSTQKPTQLNLGI